MKLKAIILLIALPLLLSAAACEKSSPSRPSDLQPASAAPASVTDARTGVTIIAAQPVSPAANAQIPWGSQPITITVTNAVTTGKTAPTYTFEVATDAAFANKVFSKDGVAQGGGAQTSLAIDKLAGSKTYFWRVRADSGTSVGPNSAVRSFTVGPEIVLQTPIPASPAQNSTAFAPLTLIVNNVQRSGPAGALVYRFQVSNSGSFGSVLFDGTTAEQGGVGSQTSISVSTALTDGATYFWRVQASDPGNSISTAFSTVFAFQPQSFSMSQAVIHDNPPDLGSWPVTAAITSIEFTPSAFLVDFSRRLGADRWPDVPFGEGDLQYTLGMCFNISSQWHCSAAIQFWFGRALTDSAPPSDIALEWFYNPARWGAMSGHQPVPGEVIGIFVAAGNLRGASYSQSTCPRICERSNVALVPFPNGSAFYPFGAPGHALLRQP